MTDSMSVRNPEYADFLEGTTQYQVYDVVVSHKLGTDEVLNIKDVVLFKNPEMGNRTVMHRIVGRTEEYDTLKVNNISKELFNGNEVIHFNSYSSKIYLTELSIKSIELEVLSDHSYNNDYSYSVGMQHYTGNVESSQKDSYYKHHVTYSSTTEASMTSAIYTAVDKPGYLSSVKYTLNSGKTFEFKASDYIPSEEPFEKHYNIRYLYEIRGDKSNTSDGTKFRNSDIYSKVDNVFRKLGFATRFLTSIPGIIMFVGLAIIISLTIYFYNKKSVKKEKQSEKGKIEDTVERNDDEGTKDQ